MSVRSAQRPAVAVDELKRAWDAVKGGLFRSGVQDSSRRSMRPDAPGAAWYPVAGERTVVVLGAAGSVGASTLALAMGLAASDQVRVVECCSATASGLAAATTAELGFHPTGWQQGRREQVLVERASEALASVTEVPAPTESDIEGVLTILDVGWAPSQVLASQAWLADAVRTAERIVLVATATVPGMRRLEGVLDILTGSELLPPVTVAVRGPRRKKWPRGVEQSAGPGVRRVLTGTGCLEIPENRELAIHGLDSRPVPTPLIAAARQLLPDGVAGSRSTTETEASNDRSMELSTREGSSR